jgi:hypothetical protein
VTFRTALALAASLFALASCGGDVATIAAGVGVVYYTKDGFTWEVEDRLIGSNTYRITVRQGKLKGSGAGEAELMFKRRAEEIAGIQGCAGYTILEYTERLETDFLGVAQRVSEGVIRCNTPVSSNGTSSHPDAR